MTTTTKFVSLLKPKRRWLQFRLKTLLVLVVIAAIPCIWLKSKMDRKARERTAVAELKRLGGVIGFDWEYDDFLDNYIPDNSPPGPAWLRILCGEDFFADVTAVSLSLVSFDQLDASMARVEDCRRLRWLNLSRTKVTDADLASLIKSIPTLEVLHLDRSRITDAGLANLKILGKLRELNVKGTSVTATGVAELQKALPKCKIIR